MIRNLEDRLGALEIVEAFHKPVERKSGHYWTTCPSCGGSLLVQPVGYVCSNRMCKFMAGSILDYSKLVTGGTWSAAVEKLYTLCSAKRQPMRDDNVSDVAEWAFRQRRILDWFIKQSEKLTRAESCKDIAVQDWMDKNYLQPGKVRFSLVAADREAMVDLDARLVAAGIDINLPMEANPVLVLPFWANHHTISSLTVSSLTDKRINDVMIQETRYSFFGLHSMGAGSRQCILEPGNPMDVLPRETFDFGTGSSQLPKMAIRFDPTQGDFSFMPEEPILRLDPKRSLSLADSMSRDVRSIRYYNKAEDLQRGGLPWEAALTRCIESEMSPAREMTSTLKVMLRGLAIEESTKNRLLQSFFRRGDLVFAEQLRRMFSDRLVCETDSTLLFSTPSGYQTGRRTSASRDTISNFTVHLNRNVLFRDDGRLFHMGEISHEGNSYPVMLSSRDLETPVAVEAQVQKTVIQHRSAASLIPGIRDRNAFKLVLHHLRESMLGLPSENGTSMLGWNEIRNAYTTPRWLVDMDGYRKDIHHLDPGRTSFACFGGSCGMNAAASSDGLPPFLQDMIACWLAIAARSFLRYPIYGIPMLHDQESQKFCEHFFAVFGQNRALVRGSNDLAGLAGYPVYGINFDGPSSVSVSTPLLSLTSSGRPIPPGLDIDDITRAGQVLGNWIPVICDWLLSGGAEGYQRRRHVLHTNELAGEGCWLIHTVLNKSWTPSNPAFPFLERLLQGVEYRALGKRFLYDFERQKVILKLEDEEVIPLDIELRRLMTSVTSTTKSIEVGASEMFDLLTRFYGQDPDIPLVRSAKV